MNIDSILIGDRVNVSGCTEYDDDCHWGEVIGRAQGDGIYVTMDDPNLFCAKLYGGEDGIPDCYLAFEHEIKDHYTMPKPLPEPNVDTYTAVAKAIAASDGEECDDTYYQYAKTAVTAYLNTLK